jgi:hypothetical protein
VRAAGLAGVWLLLLAVYAATLGIPATAGERYAGDEPHHLLAAASLTGDGDFDLTNQYDERAWAEWSDTPPRPGGEPTLGRLHEPQGIGVAVATAPAYALGGARAADVLIAAVTALAFVLAIALARRLVPDPWATGGVLLVALSPPALAAATTIAPQPIAAALLTGAILCALRIRERARLRYAYGGALMLAALPWLDPVLTLVGIPVAVCLVRWTLDERRRLVALLAAEIILGPLVFFLRLNETFYGGPLPSSARVGDAPSAGEYGDRAIHLAGLWLDPRAGLLRWAPVLALAFAGGWLLWRSRRERLARVIPERREAERAGGLLVAVVAAQWLVAAFATADLEGPWFAGLPMAAALPAAAALVAWGLRRYPRTGAVLGAATLCLGGWVLGDAWLGPAEGWAGLV